MKTKQAAVIVGLTFLTATVTACSTQAWYEGVKRGAENNCRSQPPGESERCLEKLNKQSYEEYEKERSGQK
ncbi:hypothetical protein DLREEDagrD3_08350 [Denitratisoma sp. agr-D3]